MQWVGRFPGKCIISLRYSLDLARHKTKSWSKLLEGGQIDWLDNCSWWCNICTEGAKKMITFLNVSLKTLMNGARILCSGSRVSSVWLIFECRMSTNFWPQCQMSGLKNRQCRASENTPLWVLVGQIPICHQYQFTTCDFYEVWKPRCLHVKTSHDAGGVS